MVGSKSHFANYERANLASVGHIWPTTLKNEDDGTILLKTIEDAIPIVVDNHVSPMAGLSLESTHNLCSGRVIRMDYISQVRKILKKSKISKLKFHLDGARCWNAAVFLGVDLKTYTSDFDLLSVCLSKSMGCPAGSLIVGSHEDIKEARNLRKMLGGGMRQSGVFAACGIVSL